MNLLLAAATEIDIATAIITLIIGFLVVLSLLSCVFSLGKIAKTLAQIRDLYKWSLSRRSAGE